MDQSPGKTDMDSGRRRAHASVGDLPLRADAAPEDRVPPPPGKDIHKTFGGRLTHFLIYGVLGFGANSALSVGITYFMMPKEWIKKPKEAIAKSMSGIFKGAEHERMRAANNTLEILIMFVAGTVLTAAMVPLAKNREKIAHWINKQTGKDADVLPEDMKPVPEAKTLEDKIQQEVNKHVNKHHSSGDLWKARFAALTLPFFGDMALSNWNNKREKAGKWSVDTATWKFGGKFHDKLTTGSESAKKTVNRLSEFFENHGAGIGDIEKRAPEKYPELLKTLEEKTESLNKPRAMIAEQSRMLSKEVGWTIIVAIAMERLVGVFNRRRVRHEQQSALDEVTRNGLVPDGYTVAIHNGSVELHPSAGSAQKGGTWAEKNPAKPKPVTPENFTASVENSRAAAAGQPAIS